LNFRLAARWSYLALLSLQPLWHLVLPMPMGNRSIGLALLATLPLLLPMTGVWRGSLRSLTWAGYLACLYLAVGIMEAWANPPQRLPAITQSLAVVAFVGCTLAFSREGRSR